MVEKNYTTEIVHNKSGQRFALWITVPTILYLEEVCKLIILMPTKKIISKLSWNRTTNSLLYQQKGETSLTKLYWEEALKIYKNQAVFILRKSKKKEIQSSPIFFYILVLWEKVPKKSQGWIKFIPNLVSNL